MLRHHRELGEFILHYDAVREAENPGAMIRTFINSTYERAADLAHWDRGTLDRRVVA